MASARTKSRRGGSALEMALFLPWYIFLFVGALDWGIYAHALISVENAARVGVLYTSSSPSKADDSTGACQYAYRELLAEGNAGSVVCPATSLPVIVTATKKVASGADGHDATEVSVTYRTQRLIPIPLLLPGQVTIRRVVQMKL